MNLEATSSRLASILKRTGLTLACAESCTGGLASAIITGMPGASDYFLGGIVAYSNAAKKSLLHVDAGTLDTHGAVSEQVALEMAQGAAAALEAGCAFSITGIAGPDGGSPEKPVGTVWFGFFADSYTRAEMRLFSGDRAAIREAAVDFALTGIARLAVKKFELDNPREAGVSFT